MSRLPADINLCLAAAETVYGQDAAPTGPLNAILTAGFRAAQVATNPVVNDEDTGDQGTKQVTNTSPYFQLPQFTTRMSGSGTAGDAPPIDPLVLACAYQSQVDPGVDVRYQPMTRPDGSATIYGYHYDDRLYRYLGARGVMGWSWEAGAVPRFNFDMRAAYRTPEAAVQPVGANAPDFSGVQPAIAITRDNVPVFEINGVQAACDTFQVISASFTPGIELTTEDLPGCAFTDHGARDGKLNLVITMEPIVQRNWPDIFVNNTLFPGRAVVGNTPGNIQETQWPALQVESAPDDVRGANATVNLGLRTTRPLNLVDGDHMYIFR